MQSASQELYAFHEYTLDLVRGCLRNEGAEIELRPKSFLLLRHLIQNAGRLISKDELVNTVWPNVIVGDDSLAQCMSELRNALNDRDRHIIKTVPRRGYLFAALVSLLPASSSTVDPHSSLSDEPDHEDLAVLPPVFAEQSGDGSETRRLCAVLAADVVGYSRLMGADEEGTLERLRALRRELLDPKIAKHHGRLVKTTRDGLLAEFASVVDGVRCAVELQQSTNERNMGVGADHHIELRIGVHLDDVIVEGDDLYGNGLNIAARIEALADPGGVVISNTVYEYVRDRLPVAFEDLGGHQVKNIVRPVHVYRVRYDMAAKAPSQAAPVLSLPDKPSIAVLPFANMNGDPDQEYFADGMVEEIITALSRSRWLFVIARHSTFTYKGKQLDVREVGRQLGVRYILEGSVRRAHTNVRIATQLIEAETGTHLWADRFDGSLEDVFELQDQVAISVAGVIEPTLQAAEVRRSAKRPTVDLTAYDLYLQALPHYFSLERDRLTKACQLFGQAIQRDPHYGRALVLAASCHHYFDINGWVDAREANQHQAIDFARRALLAGGDDPGVLSYAALALGYFGEDINATMALIDRALILNPSFARGWMHSGQTRTWAGQPDLAIQHFERSMRLSPRDSTMSRSLTGIGIAEFQNRRFDEAVARLVVSLAEAPGYATTYRILAAAYAHSGRFNEARDVIQRLRAITPAIMPLVVPYRNPEHRDLYLSGLRMAMDNSE